MAAKRNLNNSTDEEKAGTSKSSGKTRKKDQTTEDKQRELSERCKNDIEKELKSKRRSSSIIHSSAVCSALRYFLQALFLYM